MVWKEEHESCCLTKLFILVTQQERQWRVTQFGLKLIIVRYHENIHYCRPGSKRALYL